jgi:hypothetical protein
MKKTFTAAALIASLFALISCNILFHEVVSANAGEPPAVPLNESDDPVIYIPATHVELSERSFTLEMMLNDYPTKTITATVYPDNASIKDIFWKSSDTTVAIVRDGEITGIKVGLATITVTTVSAGHKAECLVEIIRQ